MNIIKRALKLLRRRKRVKGTAALNVKPGMTAAQKLVMNQWGVSWTNPKPARAGTIRRMKREAARRKQVWG